MNTTIAINAYKKVGVESKVIGADPHQLISMLFQGGLLAIDNAKTEILNKDIAAKGKFISKAIAIIGEGLHASLDKKVGGELAENMSSLYDYMVKRLIDANLKNDITILDEVAGLLGELAGAWDSIRPNYIQSGSQPMGSANAQLAYRRA
ncbi:MAG: flagellar export chaperone FliS [Methyloglobulus sp.]|nr:flagellar export chaperone FliS [Methyloglobulus sp.]